MVEVVRVETDHFHCLIAEALAEVSLSERVRFYNLIDKDGWFKESSSLIFKKFVHAWLVSDPTSKALPCTAAEPTAAESVQIDPVGSERVLVFGRSTHLADAR